jgi:hypothetical protein
MELADGVIDLNLRDLQKVIPLPNHLCTLSASLAVRLYCCRIAFAFTNDVEMDYCSWGGTPMKLRDLGLVHLFAASRIKPRKIS